MDRVLVVSADGHWGGPPEIYRDYLEARYHESLDVLVAVDREWHDTSICMKRFTDETLDLIDRGGAIRGGGEYGAWELDRRLPELDREGVAAELLIPGHQVAVLPFFSHINAPFPVELRMAGARAYHRQLADVMSDADGRLIGIGEPGPCVDMDQTVRDLRWLAEHGYVGVAPPGNVADPSLGLPVLGDRHYEPFWAACEDLGLVLTIHAAYGLGQRDRSVESRGVMADSTDEERLRAGRTANVSIDEFPADSLARQALTMPRRVIWQLMMAGVFDRHPALKLVLTEVRADWVPSFLQILDDYLADTRLQLRRPPRQYWADHVYVTPSSPRPHEVAMRHEIGIGHFMFGMDYPHPEGTWPNTREWIRHAFAGVAEDELRLILGANAVACYGLDPGKLRAAADRVGPTPADLISDGTSVDERLIAEFHDRSGYLRPQENVRPDFYRGMLVEDRAALAPG
jgi:predicted TIM-barrel fold metal-dependent hydrolase